METFFSKATCPCAKRKLYEQRYASKVGGLDFGIPYSNLRVSMFYSQCVALKCAIHFNVLNILCSFSFVINFYPVDILENADFYPHHILENAD